jgi:putative aminopeptidase FrvX
LHFKNEIQNPRMKTVIDGGFMNNMETVKREVFDIFCDLVRFWSPSGKEAELSAHICSHYFSEGKYVIESDELGNLMAIPAGFEGVTLPIICSHMDVHETYTSESDKERLTSVANELRIEEGNDWIFRPDDDIQIGADDKAGVALCLYIAKHTELPVKILLTVSEECGRKGVAYALENSKSFFANTSFALVLDRHSSEGNNIIHFYRGRKMAPDEMLNNIEEISAGMEYPMLRTPSPRCADAYNLALAGINTVNLSSGIHFEHSYYDQVNIQQAVNTLRVVQTCIELNEELLKSGGDDEPVNSRMYAEV